MTQPIDQPCMHAPTAAEQQRDRDYLGCSAAAGESCRWAKRWDGVADPKFHSERIEAASYVEPHSGQVTDQAFDQLVLDSGLV